MKSRLLIIFAFTSFLILVSLLSVAYLSKNKGQGSVAYTENTSNKMTGSPEALEGSGSHASNEASDKVSNETSDKASDKEGSAYLNSLTDSAPDTSPDSVKNSGDQTDDQTASEEGSEGLKEQAKEREPLPKYKDILEINPYVSGWLTIDGLTDEPVIYTPKSQNYFLHRLYDGTEAERGSLFIALNWQEGYHNTLIYGHNMKDGSCFGFLPKYADESFGMSHNLIHFDTLYEEGEYELAAVFYSQIDEDELETTEDRAAKDEIILAEGLKNREEAIRKEEEAAMTEGETSEGSPAITHEPVDVSMVTLKDLDLFEDMGDVDIYREEKDNDNGRFRYYYYTDLSDRADFDYYAENLKKNSLYDTGVDIEWGDELLTMSTCSYHVKNGRLVVVAKKID